MTIVSTRHLRSALLVATLVFGLPAFAFGNPAELAYESGQARLRARDLEGARADFDKAVSYAPEEERYLNALGLLYLQTGRGDLAALTFGRSCALTEARYGSRSSRLFGCHSLWGNALLLARDYSAAAEKFKSSFAIAFAQDPRSTEECLIALYYLAQALDRTGNLSEVASSYEHLQNSTSPINRRYPEIEDALRRVRSGQVPERLMR